MVGQKLYIIPGNDEFKYSTELSLPVSKISFPIKDNKFKYHRQIYWETEITDFEKDPDTLTLKVLNYDFKDDSPFSHQDWNTPVSGIKFEPLDWKQLEGCLSQYCKTSLSPYLSNTETFDHYISIDPDVNSPSNNELTDEEKRKFEEERKVDRDLMNQIFNPAAKSKNKLTKIKETQRIDYPIKEIQFKDGFGELNLNSKIRFPIPSNFPTRLINENIRKAFQTISKYIERALGLKNISVTVELESNDGVNYNILSIKSEDFDRINDELIETANLYFSYDQLLKSNPDEKQLGFWTPDLLTDSDTAEQEAKPIPEITNQKLLAIILSEKETLHKKELDWLSENQTIRPGSKLKLIQQPDVAFLFYIENKGTAYFILETYKVNLATYIWKFPKPDLVDDEIEWITKRYLDVEQEIKVIQEKGRNKYRAGAPNNFHRVDHLGSSNGFERWKGEMESKFNL